MAIDTEGMAPGPIGRGQPPVPTRFRKGQSGNPRGRPKGSKRQPPYETVLGQKVTVREDGRERRMTAAEAFLLHITRRGLEGDSAAARAALDAIEGARARRGDDGHPELTIIIRALISPGSITNALVRLRMAIKQDPYRKTARMTIEPWLAEAALARMDENALTVPQQQMIWKATRTPWKVKWPIWWCYQE